ncbi:acyltransferase family protein [Microbacterium sp. 22242]|uniref:acyltransferase family protein n=1 Tax=Microbacterium sp. 22242 TaxID=3453896 RepID=UPI003F8453BD
MSTSLLDATPTRSARKTLFRTDIQALRALAITLVVVTHIWPTRLSGGYVGVDVFFVISGFLITSHLTSELARTGRIRLAAFYARRIRRLLPAALLVLAVTVVLVLVFLPYPRWGRNGWEILSSATYVENWYLAGMSVNYSALNDAASAVQHYWSLSVEEQFYLVWPWLVLAGAGIAARIGHRNPRGVTRALSIVVIVVALLSFASSVVYTAVAPSQAYFTTFTRAWEFAVGALVALGAARLAAVSRPLRNVIGILGFGLVLVAAVTFNSATPFPGAAALLPVLGTAAVIAAGTGAQRQWHDLVTATAPVQWLGDVSYSLYLWHWPILVIAPFALGSDLSLLTRLLVLAVALVLAALTRRFVEVPAQRWSRWGSTAFRPLLFTVLGMAAVAALAATAIVAAAVGADADRPPAIVHAEACLGPAALAPGAKCPDAFTRLDYSVMTTKNEYFYTPSQCVGEKRLVYGDIHTTLSCDFSGGRPNATQVWLIGDSHAQQWQGAVYDLARARHWRLTTSYLGGCPIADVAFDGFRSEWGPAEKNRCRTWSHEAAQAIEQDHPDLVITAMASRHQLVDDGSGRSHDEQFEAGLQSYWKRWSARGIKVLAMADPPLNGEIRSPDCLLLAKNDPISCARPRAQAQPPDPIVAAARGANLPGVGVLDLSDRFCDRERCYAAVGGIPVYYDADHLNLEYVRLLGPLLQKGVDALLPAR